jgi:hypothetical protein
VRCLRSATSGFRPAILGKKIACNPDAKRIRCVPNASVRCVDRDSIRRIASRGVSRISRLAGSCLLTDGSLGSTLSPQLGTHANLSSHKKKVVIPSHQPSSCVDRDSIRRIASRGVPRISRLAGSCLLTDGSLGSTLSPS